MEREISTDTLAKFEDCLVNEIKKLAVFSLKEIQEQASQIVEIYERNGKTGSAKVFEILENTELRKQWNIAFRVHRSKFISNWIISFCDNNILDLVCGDGGVGKELEKFGKKVWYSENKHYDFKIPNHTALEDLMNKNKIRTADTVILGAVIHHNPNPERLIELAFESANRRVIIYENPTEGYFDDELHCLIDSFFNDGLNQTKDDCPGNHKTDLEWENVFGQFGKIEYYEKEVVVPGNPLPHSLFIVDKFN
jgi:hypothetical protein